MRKVATVWQFSLPCTMSKKCLLMKRVHFVGIICWWWRPVLQLRYLTGKQDLCWMRCCFFSSFFSFKLLFKRHKAKISSFNFFFQFSRVLKTYFNDFTIFFFREQDSFPEDSFTIHSTEYHILMSTKCKH